MFHPILTGNSNYFPNQQWHCKKCELRYHWFYSKSVALLVHYLLPNSIQQQNRMRREVKFICIWNKSGVSNKYQGQQVHTYMHMYVCMYVCTFTGSISLSRRQQNVEQVIKIQNIQDMLSIQKYYSANYCKHLYMVSCIIFTHKKLIYTIKGVCI